MIRVKLSGPFNTVRDGERITLEAGDTALVTERQLRAFRDRMTPVAEAESAAPDAGQEGEPTKPQRTLVLVDGSAGSDEVPPQEPPPPAPEGEGEGDGEQEGEPKQDAAPGAGQEGEPTGFASPAAARHAAEAGVTLEELAAAGAPSGQSGYTVADVAAVVAARAKA